MLRAAGLLLFVLLVIQINLGAHMSYLIDKFGARLFKFHTTLGKVIYGLAFIHPLLAVLSGVRLLPSWAPGEFYYNFGRMAFVLLNLAVLAALFRTTPFLSKFWHKIHILNYAVFYFVAIHSWGVGTDTRVFPFVIIYWLGVTTVTATVVSKFYKLLSSSRVSA